MCHVHAIAVGVIASIASAGVAGAQLSDEEMRERMDELNSRSRAAEQTPAAEARADGMTKVLRWLAKPNAPLGVKHWIATRHAEADAASMLIREQVRELRLQLDGGELSETDASLVRKRIGELKAAYRDAVTDPATLPEIEGFDPDFGGTLSDDTHGPANADTYRVLQIGDKHFYVRQPAGTMDGHFFAVTDNTHRWVNDRTNQLESIPVVVPVPLSRVLARGPVLVPDIDHTPVDPAPTFGMTSLPEPQPVARAPAAERTRRMLLDIDAVADAQVGFRHETVYLTLFLEAEDFDAEQLQAVGLAAVQAAWSGMGDRRGSGPDGSGAFTYELDLWADEDTLLASGVKPAAEGMIHWQGG